VEVNSQQDINWIEVCVLLQVLYLQISIRGLLLQQAQLGKSKQHPPTLRKDHSYCTMSSYPVSQEEKDEDRSSKWQIINVSISPDLLLRASAHATTTLSTNRKKMSSILAARATRTSIWTNWATTS
jgi:hypothetical protein